MEENICGFSGIHWNEPNVETLWRFEIFEFISSFNAHDPIKSNEKGLDSCIPESFVGNSSRQKLDSGPHIPDRIWLPR